MQPAFASFGVLRSSSIYAITNIGDKYHPDSLLLTQWKSLDIFPALQ